MSPPYDTNTTSDELVNDYAHIIKGKVVLTTGVSPGGLGAAFVLAIAKAQPSILILAGRDLQKVEQTAADVKASNPSVDTRTLLLDLESLKNVREAATKVNAWSDVPVIDVVVNNAALMACDYGVSADGFERQLAANHLGHFLLTNLIMGKILASSSPRVVFVSSAGHRFNPFRFGDYKFDVSLYRLILVTVETYDISSYSGWTDLQQMARLRPIQDRKHVDSDFTRQKARPPGPSRFQSPSRRYSHESWKPSRLD